MAIRTVACIGAGYVGGPTMAVMAERCPDLTFVVADRDESRVRAWQSGTPPIYEPGLEQVLRAALGRNLEFTTDVASAVRRGEMIFVSVNTPTKTFGEGAGMAADLQYWEASARAIRAFADGPRIVVEKSTVPVRTAEAMDRILNDGPGPRRFEVLSNPEFLAEGTAIRDLLEPDRVLIGGRDSAEGRTAVEELASIYARWVPRDRILTMSVWSAELAKLAANAFLAQRISSINSIAELCEATGARIGEVARAIGLDRRIGPRFLEAGVGFGGSCFRKDLLNLAYLCRAAGLDEVADYWIAVVRMNERQQSRFVAGMLRRMFNTLADKRIALFGFAFKADTGDTRDSPAIAIARSLLAERGWWPSGPGWQSPIFAPSTTRVAILPTRPTALSSALIRTRPRAALTRSRCSPPGGSIGTSTGPACIAAWSGRHSCLTAGICSMRTPCMRSVSTLCRSVRRRGSTAVTPRRVRPWSESDATQNARVASRRSGGGDCGPAESRCSRGACDRAFDGGEGVSRVERARRARRTRERGPPAARSRDARRSPDEPRGVRPGGGAGDPRTVRGDSLADGVASRAQPGLGSIGRAPSCG